MQLILKLIIVTFRASGKLIMEELGSKGSGQGSRRTCVIVSAVKVALLHRIYSWTNSQQKLLLILMNRSIRLKDQSCSAG